MATHSNTYFKYASLERFISIMKGKFKIYDVKFSTTPYDWFFDGNKFIIISRNYNQNWISVQFELGGDNYRMDDVIKSISKEIESIALLCYYQSTSVVGRFALFENGILNLSIAQNEIEINNEPKIRLVDNFGVTEEIRTKFKIPKEINQPYGELDTDELHRMMKHYGLIGDRIKDDWDYHYLMLNEKPVTNIM